jgi:tRNA U34 5-methylaminomethyl-2-thiouridine-forming methyltransferase MnmC
MEENLSLTIKITEDNSHTVYSERFQETYHSIHGAIIESRHVFIEACFKECRQNPVRIFEAGFGTGLNAYLTLQEAEKEHIHVDYHAIELYPLAKSMVFRLNFGELLPSGDEYFQLMHEIPWGQRIAISPYFHLKKIADDLLETKITDDFDLVYFDAFSPVSQPELWTKEVFEKLYKQMNKGGILTTYCAKGVVRRTMNDVGFITERIPGPPGKREMLRALKL